MARPHIPALAPSAPPGLAADALTGAADDITLLRRALGLYDPDPVIDADKTQHTGLITVGNNRTGRWAALPALMPSEELARTILRITRE